MIPELTWFAVLFLLCVIALGCLAENGTLEDTREKRMINRLADRSRKGKKHRHAHWIA